MFTVFVFGLGASFFIRLGLPIFVGLFTQFGQLFLTYGYKELPAMKAAPISYIQVLFATMIGIVFFDEQLTFNFLTGSIMVLFSIILVMSNGTKIDRNNEISIDEKCG